MQTLAAPKSSCSQTSILYFGLRHTKLLLCMVAKKWRACISTMLMNLMQVLAQRDGLWLLDTTWLPNNEYNEYQSCDRKFGTCSIMHCGKWRYDPYSLWCKARVISFRFLAGVLVLASRFAGKIQQKQIHVSSWWPTLHPLLVAPYPRPQGQSHHLPRFFPASI